MAIENAPYIIDIDNVRKKWGFQACRASAKINK